MPSCLLALGSNLGDREATLCSALAAIDAVPDTRLERRSRWYRSAPVGLGASRREFLNGAAVVETALAPLALLDVLQRIEAQHGRRRTGRWEDRALDLDILLVDELILDTATLVVPHPRMSFRPFVLEPAAEIAGARVHPNLGWTIDRLLRHLVAAANLVAIVAAVERPRRELAAALAKHVGSEIVDPPQLAKAERLWPGPLTTWVRVPAGEEVGETRAAQLGDQESRYPAAGYPKLTILLDSSCTGRPSGPSPAAGSGELEASEQTDWQAVSGEPGRGPTLQIRAVAAEDAERDAVAAVGAVWPHLGC